MFEEWMKKNGQSSWKGGGNNMRVCSIEAEGREFRKLINRRTKHAHWIWYEGVVTGHVDKTHTVMDSRVRLL